jgi:serine/threonine protein phosphatase PrpC
MKVIDTPKGKMAFAVLCDGMGGLSKGELASATVVKAFMDWANNDLPVLCNMDEIRDIQIQVQWENIIAFQNEKIIHYGIQKGVNLGTTVVAMLLTDERYYIVNVGDSRAYELTSGLRQITKDQTFVAREVKNGNMTQEEAAISPQRNVLLQCVGASNMVQPDMFFGETKEGAVYMLCSDGFRHQVQPDEIFEALRPEVLTDIQTMKSNSEYLIDLNKKRQETDNISVTLIRSF